MAHSITILNTEWHCAKCYLCWVSFMLSVIYAECHLCWVSQTSLLCWVSFCWMSWCRTIFYCMHAPMACFQNALAYFATAVSYACKMFLKLTTGLEGDRCWTVSWGLPRCKSHKTLSLCSGQNKLECLSWVCQVRLINLHQKSWQHLWPVL